jgi:hypothetical protein
MMSAIILGQSVLDPSYSVVVALLVGLVVHLGLSAIYGAIFGAIAAALPRLHQSRSLIVWAASAYGILLWLANFYVVAPFLFPWFTNANALVQFIAHTFFYGTALGLLLASRESLFEATPRADTPRRQGSQQPASNQE